MNTQRRDSHLKQRREMTKTAIAGRSVGPDSPTFIIAEAGVNHNGNLALARQLIDVAASAGADAVKFQTFRAARLVNADAPQADYQQQNTGTVESQFEMLRRLELSQEEHQALAAHCQRRGILFMSTPFDEPSADFLEALPVALFKIPSGELTNLAYLQHIAAKDKPLIISTGMASLGEVEAAVDAVEATGNRNFVLLHCVSNYPADPADVNLRAMQTLAGAFGCPVGYSDHTLGNEAALAAVALGGCVIEKHFTLDRTLPGPDHPASAEPDELAALVQGIRTVEAALGCGRKRPAASERNTAAVARKSLVAAWDLPAGSALTDDALAVKRPGNGLPPAARPYLLGRRLARNVPAGAVLTLEMFA